MNTKFLISAKFGPKEIVSEEINSFFNNNVNKEWTENLIYRKANICDVTTTFNNNNKNSVESTYLPKMSCILPIIDDKTYTDYIDKKTFF